MIEVTARLRFLRECLGSVKRTQGRNAVFEMPRSPGEGNRVMFLPTWWQAALVFAAKVANKHQKHVKKIVWDPLIDGEPTSNWRRKLADTGKTGRKREVYAKHEAFEPGATIGVNALLPDNITISEFMQLMQLAGTYRGVSPFYRDGQQYGTFEVIEITPRHRMPLPVEVADVVAKE